MEDCIECVTVIQKLRTQTEIIDELKGKLSELQPGMEISAEGDSAGEQSYTELGNQIKINDLHNIVSRQRVVIIGLTRIILCVVVSFFLV